jgi:hypothetical protein
MSNLVSNFLFVLGQSHSAKSVYEGGGEMNYQFKMRYHHTEILDRAKKYLEKREKNGTTGVGEKLNQGSADRERLSAKSLIIE